MKLTAAQIKNAKPQSKPARLADGEGLYLEISPAGGKHWRMKYRFDGKEKRLALGTFPETSLADARKAKMEAREALAKGIDPGIQRKVDKARRSADTFEALATEWAEKYQAEWSANYMAETQRRLKRELFPHLGDRPVVEISPPELLAVLRRIEARGALDLVRDVRSVFSLCRSHRPG